MPDAPDAYKGEEAAQTQAPAYLYIIEHVNDGVRTFFTSYDKPIVVTNLPLFLSEDSPQQFICGQLQHSDSEVSASFEKRAVTVTLPITDERLRRFFVCGAAVKIKIWIIRVLSDGIKEGEVINYEEDCCMINSGLLGDIAFNRSQIQASVTPMALLKDESVPRVWFMRTCNHMLGHEQTCKVDLSLFTHEAIITAADRSSKKVTLSIASPGAADYFMAGQLRINETGEIIGVVMSEVSGGFAVVTLRMWNPTLTVGQTVFVTAGCKHTKADCLSKFNNLENFGGFSYVPARNPVTSGVA